MHSEVTIARLCCARESLKLKFSAKQPTANYVTHAQRTKVGNDCGF